MLLIKPETVDIVVDMGRTIKSFAAQIIFIVILTETFIRLTALRNLSKISC